MFSYILYGVIWVVSYLPFWLLYGVADLNYVLLYHVARYRRRVVRENLRRSFPEKDAREIRRIERRYYRHMADLSVETYKLWHMSEREIRRRCVFRNVELPRRYFAEGRSVIGVLGHYGNWEWLSSFGLWEKEADFLVLYKPIRNRVVNRMTYAIRSHFGAIPVDRKDALRTIARYRSEGRLFLAGFIGDQTPNQWNLNFWTEFLHQDTPVLLGTERIATKYNLPVVSVRMRKVRRGYYEVEFVDVCAHPKELETGELTRRHTRLLESFIREEPEFWLWSHRRWKHKRVDNVK